MSTYMTALLWIITRDAAASPFHQPAVNLQSRAVHVQLRYSAVAQMNTGVQPLPQTAVPCNGEHDVIMPRSITPTTGAATFPTRTARSDCVANPAIQLVACCVADRANVHTCNRIEAG